MTCSPQQDLVTQTMFWQHHHLMYRRLPTARGICFSRRARSIRTKTSAHTSRSHILRRKARSKSLGPTRFQSLGDRPNQTYTSLTQSNVYILSLLCSHANVRNANAILCSFPIFHALCHCSKRCCQCCQEDSVGPLNLNLQPLIPGFSVMG